MTGPSPEDPLTGPPCRYFRFLFMKPLVHADSRAFRLVRGERGEGMGLSNRCVALRDVTDWQRI